MRKSKNTVYVTDNFIKFGPAAGLGEINISSLKKDEVAEALKAFLKKNRIICEHFILGIPRTRVAIKYLTLPARNDKEINRMTEYELNNLFPYKPEELIYDYAVINKQADGYSQVMLVAALKEPILAGISTLGLAGLVPEAINISTVSLFNQFRTQKRQPDNYLLINLDDAFMELLLVGEGRPVFSRGIRIKSPAEIKDLVKIAEENITIIKDKGDSINAIILSGKGYDLEDFANGLKAILPQKVEIDDSISVLEGLAAGINNSAFKINLLPKELNARKIRNKRKRAILLFLSLFLLNLSLCANIVFQKIKAKEEYLYLIRAGIREIASQASILQEKKLKAQIVKNGINSGRLTLGLLMELYRLAPEELSLNTLTISRQKALSTITLSGQARDSESVLRFANALKESALIKSADVDNISQLNAAAQERIVNFELRANLE